MKARTTLVAAVGGLLAAAGVAQGGTFHFQPYGSVAESPFAPFMNSETSVFWLEDFEDGELNTPGVMAFFVGEILGPSNWTDSVDGDGPGSLDGVGKDGYSLWVHNGEFPSLVVVFDADELGQLPTFAGLVWTDGHADATVTFEAFDATGNSLGFLQKQLGDAQQQGATAEDRFFGIEWPAGISSIALYRTHGPGGFEVDHLQYGYSTVVVPECPADVNNDGVVDVQDLTEAIVSWGICLSACPADVNGDNRVNVQDLTEIVINWGVCSTD